MERITIKEASAKVREHLERVEQGGGSRSPILDTDGGKQDLIGTVIYVLEGQGYAVVRNGDLGDASNLKLALKRFLDK